MSSQPGQNGRKYRNYHACLRACLQTLEVLTKVGLTTYLTLGGEARYVHLKFSVAMFMGDGKSSDVLCCRKTHYMQPRTSRACYTAFHDLVKLRDINRRNVSVDCEWVMQSEQRELLVGGPRSRTGG